MINLTPTQSSIYYEQELAGIYANIGGYLRIPCRINPERFAEAYRILVQTNDALRLSFRVVNGVPQQMVEDDSLLALTYVDMSAHRNPEAAAEKWMKERFDLPFLNYTDGLFDGALVKAHDALYFYHAKGNHLVLDGLSFALMGQRLIGLYKGLTDGNLDSCDTRPPSVLTFFAQEQEYLSSKRYQNDRGYWLEQHIAEFQPLFAERERSALPTSTETRRVSLAINPATYKRIEQLGKASNSSTASVFVGLLYTYFSRLFNREDIVLGLPVHNRGTAKMRKILGPLVNVNATRLSYEPSLSFAQLSARIAVDRRRDYRHQRYPISHLGREIGIYEDGRRRPFEIGFSFESSDFDLELDGNTISAIHRSNGVQQIPINFTLCEYSKAQDIWLHLDYHVGVVRDAEARSHLERLESLLERVLCDPDRSIARYPILGRRDYEVLRAEHDRTPTDVESPLCMHEMFEAKVSACPERVAIEVVDGGSLSYEQLNERANRLADCLRDSGIEAGARIGVYLERSAEMMIAVFAIMKAGAAYVPLDHQSPADRNRFIVEDAEVELVLTNTKLMGGGAMEGVDFLLVEDALIDDADDDQWMAGYSSANIPKDSIGLSSCSAAYVLYTSGSTGRPKGVVIEHRGVVNYLHHAARQYMRPEIDASVVSSPLGFDATITTLFTPLVTGARVRLLPDGDSLTVLSRLAEELIDAGGPRLFKITPAHLQAIAADASQSTCDSRHVVVVGGDQLTAQTLAPWRSSLLPHSTFINEYGPTETVVGCATYELAPDQDSVETSEAAIPIGGPIRNMRLHVIDSKASELGEASLRPIGATGELYIGGAGVARGYLHRDQLTAERFVPDPFSSIPDARLYRTGDLVRRRDDGGLEFVGRVDHQIKLRGYRIEPGEVEARLRELPIVRDAVVSAGRYPDGETYLAAYVIPGQSDSFDESALATQCRTYLEDHLPSYMVPAAFVCMDELPLTENGKLDRSVLPTPNPNDFERAAFIEPRNEVEALLCRLWSEVLSVDRVGPYDNFFSLGGHSLKATQLVALIREQLNIEVPLHAVFDYPTVARFSQELELFRACPLLKGVSSTLSMDPESDEYESGEI